MSLRSRLLLALGVVAVAALLAADVATYSALRSFLLTGSTRACSLSHVRRARQRPGGQRLVEQARSDGQFGPPSGGHRATATSGSIPADLPRGPLPVRDSLRASSPTSLGERHACSPRTARLSITGLRQEHDPGAANRPSISTPPSAQKGGPEFRVRASELSNGEQLILAVPLSDDLCRPCTTCCSSSWRSPAAALVLAGLIGTVAGARRACARFATSSAPPGRSPQGDLGHRVPGEQSQDRGGPARRGPQRHAGPHPAGLRGPRRHRNGPAPIRGPAPAVRGRRLARTAHPGRRRLGLRRAVRARRREPARGPGPGHERDPRRDGPHGPSGRGPAAPGPPGREPPHRALRRRSGRGRHGGGRGGPGRRAPSGRCDVEADGPVHGLG